MLKKLIVIMGWSALCTPLVFVSTISLAAAQHDSQMKNNESVKSMHSMKMEACRGFAVLPNGYAVLSGMVHEQEMGGMHHGHHGNGEASMSEMHGAAGPSGGMAAMGKDHLMGLKHGDPIQIKTGMLCVPLSKKSMTQWKAVSADDSLQVTAKSLRGELAHNSRDNEGFEIMVMKGKATVEGADVKVIARMPQHDHLMPGGHGLANDPDVKGIKAQPSGKGRYVIKTVDFSMADAWLFEVQVTRGKKSSSAYFAAQVGQE